jgi:EAL domain-containing protein (putative c-di-GMP-specific phosphodiesterase class I)
MQCISINLSASSLANAEVKTFLQETLPHCGIPAEKIMFEITETAAIRSYTAAQEFIRDIRRYGCKFALDDFGTGFTSYAHLKLLQCDMLKIDGGFVVDMLNNPQDLAMVKSMNDIAHALGMQTVAEWVESPEVLAKLTEIGVDYAQGYTVHRPGHIDLLSTDMPAAA